MITLDVKTLREALRGFGKLNLRSACKGEKPGTRLHFHPEEDRHLIHIHDGSIASEISCEVLPLSKYPDRTVVPSRAVDLPAACVRSIREATGSASSDPNRYILNSVFIEPEGVVATNGRILYRSRHPRLSLKDAFAGLRRTGREVGLLIGEGRDLQVHRLAPERVEGGADGFVCFNYRFLMEGLKNGLRHLTLKDELGPVLLRDAERMQLFMPLRANLKESDWKVTHARQSRSPASRKPVEKPPLKAAACKAEPEPSVHASVQPDKAPEPDPVAQIINEAAELRDSLKAGAQALGQLIKTAREANRERNDLEKEHAALKKSVRSLQKIEV